MVVERFASEESQVEFLQVMAKEDLSPPMALPLWWHIGRWVDGEM